MKAQAARQAHGAAATPGRVRAWLAEEGAQRVMALVGAALLVRLAVMPFTLHFDAYQIYSRAHEAAYHNQWFGFTSQFLIQGLHNVWLLLIRPLLPDSEGIWSHSASTIGVGASQEDYARFLAYDHLYRAIFLMKLPYVVADLGCAYVLTRLVEPARRFAVAAFWLLNPLVIFSSAIYGRHDAVAILVMLLALVAARRATDASRLLAIGLLGVATLMRFFPIIVLPPFLLAFRRSRRQLALFVGLLVGMAALVELAGLATSGKSTILTILESYEHFKYWFDAGLYLRFDDYVLLFPVAYTLGLLWVSERGLSPEEFPVSAACAFLLLFSLTFFHPHYAIWLVPFLALTIATQPRLLVYHGIQVVCVLVYAAQWGSWTTWDLLQPLLGARVASLPDPVEAIQAQIEPRIFFGLFRSVLTAVSLWMAWRLVRGSARTPPPRGYPAPSLRGEGETKDEVRTVELSSNSSVAWMSRLASPSLFRAVYQLGSGRGVRAALILLLPLVTSACTAQVSGYVSPLAHDYGPLAWQPLVTAVEQPFLVGAGYSAAFDNDATTTPAELRQRWEALPADVRGGELRELRVGVRLRDDDGTAWNTGARLALAYAPKAEGRALAASGQTLDEMTVPPLVDTVPLLDAPLDTLPREGDWLRLDVPRAVAPGAVVVAWLVPGLGPDAGRLEYGLTTDRTPYGGWPARQADGAALSGGLLVQTRYAREVALGPLFEAGKRRLWMGSRADTAFALVYLASAAALVTGTLRLWRRRPRLGEP